MKIYAIDVTNVTFGNTFRIPRLYDSKEKAIAAIEVLEQKELPFDFTYAVVEVPVN
jgi:hypothetical protein